MRYIIYIPHIAVSGKIEHRNAGRRFPDMQQATDAIDPRCLITGPAYVRDTEEGVAWEWYSVIYDACTGGMVVTPLDNSPFGDVPPPPFDVYWVCQDAADTVRGRNGLSWHVMLGDPFECTGVKQDEFDTLAEACYYINYHTGDNPVYKVRLSRIFGGEDTTSIICVRG